MNGSSKDQGIRASRNLPAGARRGMVETLKQLVLTRRVEAVCTCLLLLMAANLLVAISRKGITNDEIVRIPAGYYHLAAGDFQFNSEHPPLPKMWSALPLLLIRPDKPPEQSGLSEDFAQRSARKTGRFWQANGARFLSISYWPRVMMIPLTLALGVVIFLYARKLFGEIPALFAVALYVLEPTVLAHGRVVHNDIPAALGYLLFFFALQAYLEAPLPGRALWLGAASALALLAKFSMVVILPVLVGFLLTRYWKGWRDSRQRRRVSLHAGLIVVVVLLLVNSAYYFTRPAIETADVQLIAARSPALSGFVTSGIRVLSKVVPTYFLFGFYNTEVHNYYGHPMSLWGQYSGVGWWYYFPAAFALKTTLPFLLLAVTALLWSIWRLTAKRDKRFLFIIGPLAIYLAISVTSHINIGIRHFLPAFPFLFIMAGALLAQVMRMRRKFVGAAVLVLLFGWMSFEVVRAFPDYTPYMNQLAWQHPHWYYLSDSNVEWGDDVPALAQYLRARGETRVRAALLAGWMTLPYYGVDYIDIHVPPGTPSPDTHYVAIGASFLNGSTVTITKPGRQREDFFAEYRDRVPEAVFGNSIYLYREK